MNDFFEIQKINDTYKMTNHSDFIIFINLNVMDESCKLKIIPKDSFIIFNEKVDFSKVYISFEEVKVIMDKKDPAVTFDHH